jgi:tetratricopeptide (TPR) repeat protein
MKGTLLLLFSGMLFVLSVSLLSQEKVTSQSADEEKLSPKFTQALTLFKEKKYEDAEKIFNELLTEEKNNMNVYIFAAQNYVNLSKSDKALNIVDMGLKKEQKNIALLKIKAGIFMLQRETGDAIDVLEEATEYYPQNAGLWMMLASQYLMDQEWSDCIEAAEKAAEIDPKNPVPYTQIGMGYIAKKKFKEAIASFDKALAIDKNFKPAVDGRSLAQRLEKQAMEEKREKIKIEDAPY